MADLKLSQATAAGSLTGSELAYVVQGGNSRSTTTGAIAGLAPGTNLTYDAATRLLSSSTGADATLPLATDALDGLQSAAHRALVQALIAAGVTAAGSTITIPHIHGDIAGSLYVHIKNTSGGTLVKGTPLRITGQVGDTPVLEVAAADSANAATMPAFGVLSETIANNDPGHAVVAGELLGLNTGGLTPGTILYVAAGGGSTATRPTSGVIQQIAIVGRVHASTGGVTVTVGSLQSPNWDTAYSERLRWDGGATGLNAATGRTSLELGTAAGAASSDFVSATATRAANLVFAGPASGAAAAPTFRALTAADIPATTVAAGSYGSGSSVAAFTVDAQGRLTAVGNITISLAAAAISDSTSTGRSVLTALDGAAARSAISAETAGAAAAAQAAAVQRNNHTGTQLASTISDFSAAVAALGNAVWNSLRSLANPSAVSFLRLNADNSVTARSAPEMRTDLGLGSAAQGTIGTAAGNVVALDNSARLPAVDASQLTNLPSAFNPAIPGPIGGTTPAAGTFTALVASARLSLPSGAPASPAARDLYQVADTLRYRGSDGVERLLLNGADNLANLTNLATARSNLGLTSAATATIGTAAGNLVALDGSARLPAVDGSLLTGLPSAGTVSAYRVGAYFFPNLTSLGPGAAVTQNRIELYPFRVLRRVQVSGIAARVTTAMAGGQFQLALYGAGAGNLPAGDPLVTTGSMSTAAAATVTTTFSPIWLEPTQIYYRGLNVTGGSTAAFVSPPLTFPEGPNLVGILSPFSAQSVSNLAFQFTSTFGTWPNVTGQSFAEAGGPAMAIALLASQLG